MSNISTVNAKPVRATLTRPTTQIRTKTATRTAAKTASQTGSKPHIAVRARLVSYPQKAQRAKAKRLQGAVSQLLMFVFLTFITFGVSSIAGQVMVEQSRRDESNAKTTTLSALRTETDLRSRLLELTNPESIATWATEHQFTNTGVAAKSGTHPLGLVALRY